MKKYKYNYIGNTYFEKDVELESISLLAAARKIRKELRDAGISAAKLRSSSGETFLVNAEGRLTEELY